MYSKEEWEVIEEMIEIPKWKARLKLIVPIKLTFDENEEFTKNVKKLIKEYNLTKGYLT